MEPFDPDPPKSVYNWSNFEYYLDQIDIESDNNETLIDFNQISNEIQYKRNYMILRNYVSDDIISKIKANWETYKNENKRNEARAFGYAKGNIKGHNMTYLNDVFDDNLYEYFKDILKSMLYSFKQYTLNQINSNYDRYGKLKYESYISQHWAPKYDWQSLINMSNSYESRVIEYISYAKNGYLGWHHDDHSNVSIVIMLSNHSDFNGNLLISSESYIYVHSCNNIGTHIYRW